MRCFKLLFAASALVAVPVWGAEIEHAVVTPRKEVNEAVEALGPLLNPSRELIDFEKRLTEAMLKLISSFATPQQIQRLKNVAESVREDREKQLEIYNNMKAIQEKMEGGDVSTEEEAELRKEMRSLIAAFKAISKKMAKDSRSFVQDEGNRYFEIPIVKELDVSIESFVLSPFERYT